MIQLRTLQLNPIFTPACEVAVGNGSQCSVIEYPFSFSSICEGTLCVLCLLTLA